ncbi:hypothetical protein ACJD0Z_04670 [Flavobacteriaceae bacterium M23B6Z8]
MKLLRTKMEKKGLSKKQLRYLVVSLLMVISFFIGRESKEGKVNHRVKSPEQIDFLNPPGMAPSSESPSYFNEFLNNGGTVFICTGKYSRRYHLTKNCKGISSCQKNIVEVSLEEAQNRGRNLCRWEN